MVRAIPPRTHGVRRDRELLPSALGAKPKGPDPRVQRITTNLLKRFTGWAFVLAGVGYILAWLILPTTPANIVATGLCLLATALILSRRALTRLRP